ncbi:MAG: phosphoadenosine phosphosulfate reductase family protein [Magnetovibrio sp.]|nr:phosphoadenosine phosphosulfate reductase family protein [Magnetovibrio sp.]
MDDCAALDCTQIKAACQDMACTELLEFLIKEKFPGKIAVTASLRARSVIVQHMISEIDPTIPIIYCNAGKAFPESKEYQQEMVSRFGFTRVLSPIGTEETAIQSGDLDHIEWVKAQYDRQTGGTQEAMHLNNTLAKYDCWISAVYHFDQDSATRSRVEREGLLVRVNPILDWDADRVQDFMTQFELPYHKLAKTPVNMDEKHGDGTEVQTMAF